MKRIIYMLVAMATAQLANAQAILPTSFNFDDATPTGWSESLNSGNTRYAAGFVGQACRLDGTTDYVLVEFSEEPGPITYYIKGQNTGGNWMGTFTVEESTNGADFTPLHTFVDADMITSSFTEVTDQAQSSTRFIRFYFTNKVSGHNVALDEVELIQPTVSPEQEINVTINNMNVPNGFTASIGNSASTEIVIQNLGTANTLNIADIVLSGADAAQFSLGTWTADVMANSEGGVMLDFTPAGDGSRFCTITITSNDANEAEYVINIYAIAGTLATEPTASPTDLWFPALNEWNYHVNFDAASPAAEKYLVLRKKGGAVTEMPIDGNTYLKGVWIGNAQVVHVGPAGEFDARYIDVSTTYHFAVFSMNGPAGFENYKTDAPLTGSVTTDDPEIGTTWATVDVDNANFINQLNAAMNPPDYFQTYYSNYTSTLINEFYVRDTVIGGLSQNFVECQYSGLDYVYPAGFQWWNGSGDDILSREHTFPQSWMPTYLDSDFEDSFEYSDLHNLIPVQQEACNAIRSNYPYGDVVTPSYTYLDTKFGDNANGQDCYEPRDEIKGDAARGMMYHSVKNNVFGSADFSFPEQIGFLVPYGQLEYVVKKWHFEDPATNYERAKNEYIYDEQHNRNAFVDNPEYPCYIRFSNLTKWTPLFTVSGNVLTCIDPALSYQWYKNGEEIDGAAANTYTITESANYSVEVQQFIQCPVMTSASTSVTYVGVDEGENVQFSFGVYPNPSQGSVTIGANTNASMMGVIRIYDCTGKVIYNTMHSLLPGNNCIAVEQTLSAGIYVVELQTEGGLLTEKIVVE
ncbi:MAG: endonuclease [Flavobacteriales bacterium]